MKQGVVRPNHLYFLVMLMALWLLPPAAFAETDTATGQASPPIAKKLKTINKSAHSDLVVANINMSPGKPNTNSEIVVWTFVKNVGRQASQPSTLQLQIGGKIYPAIDVPALPVNQEWRYTANVKPLPAGNYRITAVVNPQKQTAEKRYDNNKRIRNFTVTTGPTVFIKDITWDRQTKLWVATVKNSSAAAVPVSIAGFPLENGATGMTKWAHTTLPKYGTFDLTGDYSSYNVPVGTRLKVHVIKKNTNAVLDQKVLRLN